MRAWIAGRAWQAVGTLGKEPDIRAVAAELDEIPRTVDIRDLLETDDHGRDERERERYAGGASPQLRESRQPRARNRDRERREADESHEPAAGLVDEVDRPPAVRADESLRRAIVEERLRNVDVEIPRDDRPHRERYPREPCTPSRDTWRRSQLLPGRFGGHDQKLRLVWRRSCTLSMEAGPSSGKARSTCNTLPSALRELPSRKPMPTSLSQP